MAQDEQERVRKKNAALFVEVMRVDLRGAPVADVRNLDALVKVAKKYETMIMAVPHATGHDYVLWDDGLAFRFRTSPVPAPDPEKAPKPRTATRTRRAAAPLETLRRAETDADPG